MEDDLKLEDHGQGNSVAMCLTSKNQRKDQKKNTLEGIRHTKKKRENWRPKKGSLKNTNPGQKAFINNCEVMLRHCRSFVMFEITTLTALIAKSLPLRMSDDELKALVAAFAKARRPQMAAEAKAWRHDFLSWKAFKHFLEHNLHDQCLKDILRTYVPHEGSEVQFGGSLGVGKAPSAFLGNNENDFIKIAGVTVPFFVKGNKVYFDLLGAFTLMGQLQVALKNDWRDIDDMLEKQGFNLRTAFRINTSPVSTGSSYKTWKSQRSAITYEALKALVISELMPKGPRKTRLKAILEHLDTDMMGITRAREDLIYKIQTVVDASVLPTLDPLIEDGSIFTTDDKVLMGTEICYRGCGRYYHFTIKCCRTVHKMLISKSIISYIVHEGQIFLEKCAAFSVMGKMCVVRFSDYRTVDRHLASAGLEIGQHFLYEHSFEEKSPASSGSGGRRTHISLLAFKTLYPQGSVAHTSPSMSRWKISSPRRVTTSPSVKSTRAKTESK